MPSMIYRPRRLRRTHGLRDMVRETRLSTYQFVLPLFVCEGANVKREIASMPGVFNFSVDNLAREIESAIGDGIASVLLFGIPDEKDEAARGAYDENGIVQRAIRQAREVAPHLNIIADTCLCEYTAHGHCGVVENGQVLNDESLELLARTAVSQAAAGASIVAPSAMMDNQVAAIREALDANGFTDTAIMAYSSKFASAFYGPFRDAAQSVPAFGDRRAYQMDGANRREAVREARLDYEQGADILMVKPAGAYLDIVREVRDSFDVPLAAYHVSGEYAMIKAAARLGWIDERRVMLETLTGIRRAGADIIITYYARDAARELRHIN